MQCFFVSKDYLLAVSSTAVDRHGQPFRDSMKNPPKSAERPARGSRKRQLEPGPQVTETHDKQDTKQDKGTKQPFLPLSWWCLLWVLPRGGPPGQGLCEHPKSKNTHFQISIFTFFAKAWKNNKCHATFVGSTYPDENRWKSCKTFLKKLEIVQKISLEDGRGVNLPNPKTMKFQNHLL